ncbi:MAG: nuclear transport factor 2 family protein [Chloroflexales bacterium]|nr:nuclear transport factor 2 family protein [Chloroflexales bacterium]
MSNEIETIMQDLERQLRTATLQNDIDLHKRLLADTWLNTNANGTVTTKPQLLALLEKQPFAFLAIENEDVLIRHYNAVAIVTGRSTRRRAGSDQQVISQVVRFTRVYTYLEDQWQIVSAQSTPIAR